MKLSMTVKKNSFLESLDNVAKKQIPFAGMMALNATAFKIRADEQRAMDKHLDKPIPFTKRGVRVRKANKRKLVATVYLIEKVANYMKYSVAGGTKRPAKKALLVPIAQRRNKYGNVPRTTIKRLKNNPKIFFGKPRGRATAGVYQRMGTKKNPKLRLLFKYQGNAQYSKLYPFYAVAERRTRRTFQLEYARALRRAMQSAR